MKRFLACALSVVLALGLMPAFAVAGDADALHAGTGLQPASAPASASVHAQAVPSIPEAHPEAVTGAAIPADMSAGEVRVEDFRKSFNPHYYGPKYDLDESDADASIIETALKAAEGKTLVFEKDKTYTIGTYVRSNDGGIWGRSQGIESETSNVIIEGNGATLQWKDDQPFVDGGLFVLKGTKDHPVKNVVIRNLNIAGVNNSRNYTDPLTGKSYPDYNVVQLKGFCCENVFVENCTFTATPNPDPALKARSDAEGRGLSNIWFYGGAKNITVRDCTLIDVTNGSQESGSNLLFSGECEWLRGSPKEFQDAYAKMTVDEQYQTICENHMQGRVENILVENNTFEHACHDESFSMWCAEIFKDVLVRNNRFNVHDGDAHVPSTVNFTFGLPTHHDKFENLNFTHNDVYSEATWASLVFRADMGSDFHITDNDLSFRRVKLFRERVKVDGKYVIRDKQDLEATNGMFYAAYNKDYVDVSGNRVVYDKGDGEGLMTFMGTKNLLCKNNTFIANGPLSYLAYILAGEAAGAAGHESIFIDNTFDINGELKKSLIRGGLRFTGNVVRLNGTVKGDGLFSISGNFEGTAPSKTNKLYTLTGDVDMSDNKVFVNTAVPNGLPALFVYDASFAGHALNFTNNEIWSTIGQSNGNQRLVYIKDVQGATPTVDATGTSSNLFGGLRFHRTGENESGYDDYQGTLTDPKVIYGNQEYTVTDKPQTQYPLESANESYDGDDPDESTPATGCEASGHSWSDPEYAWVAGVTACTARRVCLNDPHHVEERTVGPIAEITRAATCTQMGETTYTAEFPESYFAAQAKTFENVPVDPDAHKWGPWEVKLKATVTSTGRQTRTCELCGTEESKTTPVVPKTDLSKATVSGLKTVTYNGKAKTQSPVVKLEGKPLKVKADYTLSYKNNVKAGTATITVKGAGSYKGSVTKKFTIEKAANPMKVKVKSPSVKASKLKRANQTIAAKQAFTVTKAKGKVTYKKTGGNKQITVSSAGKITVKKNLKSGTYQIKVKVTAKGNGNYKAGSKAVTMRIRVVK